MVDVDVLTMCFFECQVVYHNYDLAFQVFQFFIVLCHLHTSYKEGVYAVSLSQFYEIGIRYIHHLYSSAFHTFWLRVIIGYALDGIVNSVEGDVASCLGALQQFVYYPAQIFGSTVFSYQ